MPPRAESEAEIWARMDRGGVAAPFEDRPPAHFEPIKIRGKPIATRLPKIARTGFGSGTPAEVSASAATAVDFFPPAWGRKAQSGAGRRRKAPTGDSTHR